MSDLAVQNLGAKIQVTIGFSTLDSILAQNLAEGQMTKTITATKPT